MKTKNDCITLMMNTIGVENLNFVSKDGKTEGCSINSVKSPRDNMAETKSLTSKFIILRNEGYGTKLI